MQIDEGKVDAGHFVESMLGRRTVGLFAKFASSLVLLRPKPRFTLSQSPVHQSGRLPDDTRITRQQGSLDHVTR